MDDRFPTTQVAQQIAVVMPAIVILALWEVGGGSVAFPPPSKIAGALMHRSIVQHALATLKRAGIGIAVGCSIGFLAGVCLAAGRGGTLHRRARMLIGAPMAFLMPVPGVALAPLAIVLFGFGDRTIVPLGLLAAVFPTAYNTAAGINAVPCELTEAAAIEGASSFETLRYVTLPLSLKHIKMGLKLSISRAWRTVIAVEFVAAASTGLGWMIWDAAEYARSDIVLGGIVAIVVLFSIAVRLLGD